MPTEMQLPQIYLKIFVAQLIGIFILIGVVFSAFRFVSLVIYQ